MNKFLTLAFISFVSVSTILSMENTAEIVKTEIKKLKFQKSEIEMQILHFQSLLLITYINENNIFGMKEYLDTEEVKFNVGREICVTRVGKLTGFRKALEFAVEKDNVEALNLMVSYGANLTTPNTYNFNTYLIHHAASFCSVNVFKELLKMPAINLDAITLIGKKTALDIAQEKSAGALDEDVKAKYTQIIRLINDKKIADAFKSSIESTQKFNLQQLLEQAIKEGNIYKVKFLLSLPLQQSVGSPLTTLRLCLQLAKVLCQNNQNYFDKKIYRDLGRQILQRLRLLGEEGLISKHGLSLENIEELPIEIKLHIDKLAQ